jgi:hypothetical protein
MTLLNEDAQKLRDNAALLDELSNKLEQKAQYFRGLADNASIIFIGYLIDQYLPFFTLTLGI